MNSKNENLLAEFGGHFFMRKNTPGGPGVSTGETG